MDAWLGKCTDIPPCYMQGKREPTPSHWAQCLRVTKNFAEGNTLCWPPSNSVMRAFVLSCLSCSTHCDPMDCSPPGSSVHGMDSPGKNIGVGCHSLLQRIFPNQESNPFLLCLLHWQVGSLPLSSPGKANSIIFIHNYLSSSCSPQCQDTMVNEMDEVLTLRELTVHSGRKTKEKWEDHGWWGRPWRSAVLWDGMSAGMGQGSEEHPAETWELKGEGSRPCLRVMLTSHRLWNWGLGSSVWVHCPSRGWV